MDNCDALIRFAWLGSADACHFTLMTVFAFRMVFTIRCFFSSSLDFITLHASVSDRLDLKRFSLQSSILFVGTILELLEPLFCRSFFFHCYRLKGEKSTHKQSKRFFFARHNFSDCLFSSRDLSSTAPSIKNWNVQRAYFFLSYFFHFLPFSLSFAYLFRHSNII